MLTGCFGDFSIKLSVLRLKGRPESTAGSIGFIRQWSISHHDVCISVKILSLKSMILTKNVASMQDLIVDLLPIFQIIFSVSCIVNISYKSKCSCYSRVLYLPKILSCGFVLYVNEAYLSGSHSGGGESVLGRRTTLTFLFAVSPPSSSTPSAFSDEDVGFFLICSNFLFTMVFSQEVSSQT